MAHKQYIDQLLQDKEIEAEQYYEKVNKQADTLEKQAQEQKAVDGVRFD